jgi:hypothetical protein
MSEKAIRHLYESILSAEISFHGEFIKQGRVHLREPQCSYREANVHSINSEWTGFGNGNDSRPIDQFSGSLIVHTFKPNGDCHGQK